MKFKILIIFVCIFLVGTSISKDVEVTERLTEKGYVPFDQYFTDQSVRRNFIGVAMAGYPVLDNAIECVVTRSESGNVEHTVEFYSDANKNIRIHALVTGPQFEELTSNKWAVKANTYYSFAFQWQKTWKAGVYKITFVIEVIGGKGGSTLVETYSFIVY